MPPRNDQREMLELPGYRHPSVIGGGASSTVYKAEDVELSRWVAIKVLLTDDPEDPARKRFKREGTITANLGKHPHIVQVLATGFTDSGTPFVVMELFEQGSIADRLRSSGTFSVAETLDIGIKIADAVSAAHRAGVLHRDIKPQNILLSEYGPALGDFGIARTAANLEWSQSLDQLTPMHAAPEVLLGGTSTAQSDIYSLGSSLYTMLAGRAPFAGPPGEAPLRFQVRVMQDAVPPIPRADVPAAVTDLLEQALAKNPADRPASATDFGAALQSCLRELGRAASPPSAPERPAPGSPVAPGGPAAPAFPVTGTAVAPSRGTATDAGAGTESAVEEATVTRSGARAGAQPAGIDRPGTGADLGDASTVLPDIPGVASFLGSVEAPPAPSSTGRPGPPGGPGPAGRPDLPLVDTEPLPAADPFGAAGSAPIPGGPTDGAVGDMGEGTATVHRPIRTLDPEPPPADADQRRGGRRRLVIAVAAVIVLVAVAAVVLVTRSPRHPTPVKKVHTVTTVAKDKPTHLALTGTAGKAVLAWTAPAGSRLRYLVVEVTTHGNKVLGKTAAGKTSLTVPAVDPATTQDCFEVTAVLSATKVGAPASWCPTGESVTGG